MLVPLQRDAVEASLRDFAADALAPVAALAARLGLPVELLSLLRVPVRFPASVVREHSGH